MSLIEAHRKESPRTLDSWLKMWHAVMRAMERKGESVIIWKNMPVDKCKIHEQMAMELEYYEVACIFRDNIHKCYDYKPKQ
jgi:hypothetical protein